MSLNLPISYRDALFMCEGIDAKICSVENMIATCPDPEERHYWPALNAFRRDLEILKARSLRVNAFLDLFMILSEALALMANAAEDGSFLAVRETIFADTLESAKSLKVFERLGGTYTEQSMLIFLRSQLPEWGHYQYGGLSQEKRRVWAMYLDFARLEMLD